MSDLAEIKGLFEATQKVAEAARQKAEEATAKSADFIDRDTLKKMEEDLAKKMSDMDAKQAAMAAKLDEAQTKANRPGGAAQHVDSPAAKAFDAYIRKGTEPQLDEKAMATNVNADGGYLVPDVMRDGIQTRLRRSSPVRAVASVVSISGGSYEILVERGDTGFAWAGETETRSETDSPTVNRITITRHELSAMPKVSQRLLDEAAFDVGGWLTGAIGDRFSRAEATAFVSGSGYDQPKGFLSYSTAATADETRATAALQHRLTGTSGAFDATAPADALVHLFYDLQGAYQANASWMAKNTVMAKIATMKDAEGQYLIREILNASGNFVRTIMGRPAYIADDMPEIGAGSLSVAVGDFAAGYTIVDGPQISILRDPFSAKPHVLFYATKRVGGGVSDFDAIKVLKFSNS